MHEDLTIGSAKKNKKKKSGKSGKQDLVRVIKLWNKNSILQSVTLRSKGYFSIQRLTSGSSLLPLNGYEDCSDQSSIKKEKKTKKARKKKKKRILGKLWKFSFREDLNSFWIWWNYFSFAVVWSKVSYELQFSLFLSLLSLLSPSISTACRNFNSKPGLIFSIQCPVYYIPQLH